MPLLTCTSSLLSCSAALIVAVGPRSVTDARESSAGYPASVAGLRQAQDTIVRIAGRPRHPGGAMLVRELTIGSVDGPEEYSFTSIADALLVRDGTIIIVDRGATRGGTPFVRQYDAQGRYIRTIGRKGQGPGEYVSPAGIVQLADGRILIRDGAQRRINVYSESGESIDTWRLDPGLTVVGAASLLMLDTTGVIYRRDFMRPQTARQNSPPMGLVRMRADGTVIDTMPPPELPALPAISVSATGARNTRSARIPYSPSTTWAWSPLGYAVTGRTDRYAIDLRIPPVQTAGASLSASARSGWNTGDPVISIRRTVSPVEISLAERNARRAGIEATMRTVDPQWTWTGPDIPRHKPAFRALRIAEDGRIWVTTSAPSERYTPEPASTTGGRVEIPFREPTIYDIFEPDGTYLGQLRLPERTTLTIMRGNVAWGVVRDENDVESLQRFRIVWK